MWSLLTSSVHDLTITTYGCLIFFLSCLSFIILLQIYYYFNLIPSYKNKHLNEYSNSIIDEDEYNHENKWTIFRPSFNDNTKPNECLPQHEMISIIANILDVENVLNENNNQDNNNNNHNNQENNNNQNNENENKNNNENDDPGFIETFFAFTSSLGTNSPKMPTFSKLSIFDFFDWLINHLLKYSIKISPNILNHLIFYLIEKCSPENIAMEVTKKSLINQELNKGKRRSYRLRNSLHKKNKRNQLFFEHQDRLVKFLQKINIPKDLYNELLLKMNEYKLNRAALVLYRSNPQIEEDDDIRIENFNQAIKCYINDLDINYKKQVFPFLFGEISLISSLPDSKFDNSRSYILNEIGKVILSDLPLLAHLDHFQTCFLIAEYLAEDYKKALNELISLPKIQLEFLDYVICSQSKGMNPSIFDDIIIENHEIKSHISYNDNNNNNNNTDTTTNANNKNINNINNQVLSSLNIFRNVLIDQDDILLYVQLLADNLPDKMIIFLSNFDNYPLDKCLDICKKKKITDATAYLLERTGALVEAINITLHDLSQKLDELKFSIEPDDLDNNNNNKNNNNNNNKNEILSPKRTIRRMPSTTKYLGIKNILITSLRGNEVRKILDVAISICERNSFSSTEQGEKQSLQLWFMIFDFLVKYKNDLGNVLYSYRAEKMKDVIDQLLQDTLKKMVGHVPLPEIVKKITSDKDGNSFSDFREIILSMIESYGDEIRIYNTASSIVYNSVFEIKKEWRKLGARAVRVKTIGTNYLPYLLIEDDLKQFAPEITDSYDINKIKKKPKTILPIVPVKSTNHLKINRTNGNGDIITSNNINYLDTDNINIEFKDDSINLLDIFFNKERERLRERKYLNEDFIENLKK